MPMDAGQALWSVYAVSRWMASRNPVVADHLRACVEAMSQGFKLPLPADEQAIAPVVQWLEANAGASVPVAQSAQSSSAAPRSAGRSGGGRWGTPERIEAGQSLVKAMQDSGLFEWAEVVDSIAEQLDRAAPFITDKQFRALVNVACSSRNEGEAAEFWSMFESEHEEAARFARECADSC